MFVKVQKLLVAIFTINSQSWWTIILYFYQQIIKSQPMTRLPGHTDVTYLFIVPNEKVKNIKIGQQ